MAARRHELAWRFGGLEGASLRAESGERRAESGDALANNGDVSVEASTDNRLFSMDGTSPNAPAHLRSPLFRGQIPHSAFRIFEKPYRLHLTPVRVSFQTYTGFISNPYGFRIEPGKARAHPRTRPRARARARVCVYAFDMYDVYRVRSGNVSHEVTKPRRRRGVLAPQLLPFACFLTCVRSILCPPNKELKEIKEIKEIKEFKEIKAFKEDKELKELKEDKELKELKEIKEIKEDKEDKDGRL